MHAADRYGIFLHLLQCTAAQCAQIASILMPKRLCHRLGCLKVSRCSDAGSFGFMTPGMTATPASASFQQDTPGPEMQDTWQNAFNNVGNAVPQSTVSPHPARLATVMHPSETRDSHQHALFTESRFKNQHNASALARPLHVQQIPPQRLSCTIKFQHRSSVTASLIS